MTPMLVIAWTRLLAVTAALLASAPIVALVRSRDEAPGPSVRATGAGAAVVAWGALLAISAPLLVLVAIASAFALTGRTDLSIAVPIVAAAVCALAIGPALVVIGRRMRAGSPTTYPTAAAAGVLQALMLAGAALALVYEDASTMAAIGTTFTTFVIALAPVAAMVLAPSCSGDATWRALAMRRVAGSSFLWATLLGLASLASLWIGLELDDRASVATRHALDWYRAVEPAMLVLAGACALATLVDLGAALFAWRAASRAAASLRG
jgi:hypothetical protein